MVIGGATRRGGGGRGRRREGEVNGNPDEDLERGNLAGRKGKAAPNVGSPSGVESNRKGVDLPQGGKALREEKVVLLGFEPVSYAQNRYHHSVSYEGRRIVVGGDGGGGGVEEDTVEEGEEREVVCASVERGGGEGWALIGSISLARVSRRETYVEKFSTVNGGGKESEADTDEEEGGVEAAYRRFGGNEKEEAEAVAVGLVLCEEL